jgi:hypothetical protein
MHIIDLTLPRDALPRADLETLSRDPTESTHHSGARADLTCMAPPTLPDPPAPGHLPVLLTPQPDDQSRAN